MQSITKIGNGSATSVKFIGRDGNVLLDSTVLKKINKFSLQQLIRIKTDDSIIQQIKGDFELKEMGQDYEKIKGTIGRVVAIDHADADRVFVRMDNEKIHKWLYKKGKSLPTNWMEPYESAYPAHDDEMDALAAKQLRLFFDVVDKGNLRVAQLLHHRYGVDVGTRNSIDGMTALHIACLKGHFEVVQWILEEALVDLEEEDNNGFRAIHHAAKGYI